MTNATIHPQSRAPKQAPRPVPSKRISAAKQRKLVETAIERLVDLLDAIELDADLEDNADAEPDADGEPTMGWQNEGPQSCLYGQTSDGDNEPWLGWTELEARYGKYSELACSDLEEQCEDEGAEHDGREPDADDEVQSWTNPMAENRVGEVRS